MPRAGINKQIILQTAVEIADSEGLDKLNLASISQKLGIRTPSLYNHVDGLEGLKILLTVHGMNQLESEIAQAAIGKSKDEAMRSISQAYLAFARKHPGLYKATQYVNDFQDDRIRQASDRIVDLVSKVVSAYNLKHENAIHVIRMFRSLLHGFATIENTGGFGIPLDVDDSFDLSLTIFLKGIHSMYL